MTDELPRPLSHSSISQYLDCQQKYAWHYVHGLPKEEPGSAALFSKEVIHPSVECAFLFPDDIERFIVNLSNDYNRYIAAGGLTSDPLFSLIAAEKALRAASRWTQQGAPIVDTEKSYRFKHQDLWFLSIPDVIRLIEGEDVPLDIKYTSAWDTQQFSLAFGDQWIGQAVVTGASKVQCLVLQAKKTRSGEVSVESDLLTLHITPSMKEKWLAQMVEIAKEIEWKKKVGTWSRNAPSACFRFNRTCPYLLNCLEG